MKKLQNNYTTPEQSKEIAELGVPADSADMYYKHTQLAPYVFNGTVLFSVYSDVEDITPCWSVGRLIEIYLTCALDYHPYDDFYTETPSLHFMAFDKDRLIEEVIEIMSEDKMDFSKLEE